MVELSVIVPVYKVETYLPKCIDSILAQTFRNFELILVDDGSPDNCGRICEEYAAQDSRIKVIHQANAGVSAARNAGLETAEGAYIGFVDADDWIEPEMYDTMLNTAKETGADVVVCGIRYSDVDAVHLTPSLQDRGAYDRENLLKELFGMPNRLGGGACNKLFARKALQAVRFRRGVAIAEDWLFLYEAFLRCESGVKIADPFYTVVERPGSATRGEDILIYSELLLSSKLLLLLLCREHTPQLEGAAIDKYLDDCLRYVPQMKAAGKQYGQPYRKAVWRIKGTMLKEILRGWSGRLLPGAKLRGYLFEWFRL